MENMFVTNLLFLEKKHHFFTILYPLYKAFYVISDSFFPQMRPEKFEEVGPDLNENEQLIFDLLEKEGKMDLNVLKEQSGLSNKKWDKGVKGLRKHDLIKVQKNGDDLTIEVLEK